MKLLLIFIIALPIFSSASESFHELYVDSNGFHTDFIIKRDDLDVLKDHPDYSEEYIAIGFGDEGFWRAGDFFNRPFTEQAAIAFDSLILEGQGVMSVIEQYRFTPEHYHSSSNFKIIRLEESDYQKLVNYINQSFLIDEANEIIFIDSIGQVNLYKSTKRYSATFTCNSWIARALSQTSHFHFNAVQSQRVMNILESQEIETDIKDLNVPSHMPAQSRSYFSLPNGR